MAAFAATALAAPALHPQPPAPLVAPGGVLRTMERAADWQLEHPSSHPLTDWTQGAGDAGFMALAGISADPKYRDAMHAVGERTFWEPGSRIYHADDHCVGQTYAELYMLYRDPAMIARMRARCDAILEKPSGVSSMDFSQPGNRATEQWSWCDALFMGPPAWMRLYAATGDARYMDFAVRNWWITADFLYDKEESLFYRDSTYFKKRESNGRKVFWSRGNGWVMAGLVRVLQSLPAQHAARPRFERMFQDMAGKVLSCQQADGLWRASLLDPASYPLREASGSGFFTYALAWGVNQGLLDGARFTPAIVKAWSGLSDCVGPDGRLGHVQPIGADPKRFSEDATEVYGVGAFLLAGSEVYRLAIGMPDGAGARRPGRREVRVTNPAPFFRGGETVEVDPRGFAPGERIAVMDGVSSRILDSQLYASEPGQLPDKLLFQVDLAAGETRSYWVLAGEAAPAAVPQPVIRTYVRQVAERYNDVAWESDRIAHRMYSQDLIKGEGTISSGIDVWAKRTHALIVNAWYKRANYHVDDGDGLDDYQVGRSRGCGGLGVWSGGRLYVSSNFRSARIITTGPIRSEFELSYDAWNAGGRMIAERKRISIDAGSSMSRAACAFSCDDARPIEIGVGIALRAGVDRHISKSDADAWMSYWQPPDRDRGSIGCAVILPRQSVRRFVTENASIPAVAPEKQLAPGNEGLPPVANLLAIIGKNPSDPLPMAYYFGAGWSKDGEFPSEASWTRYVARFRERLDLPLGVGLGP